MFGWLFKKSPEQLHKEREARDFFEGVKGLSIEVGGRGGIRLNGLSEYGARKLLAEGTEASFGCNKVMTDDGELIPWEEWKRRETSE